MSSDTERGVPPPPPSGRSPSPAGGGDDAAPPASPPPTGEGDHAQHGGGGTPVRKRALAPKKTIQRARDLRRRLTPPEARLWVALRARPNGLKFRRQHPVGPYVLDFYCEPARLAIEVDGAAHDFGDRPARDLARDAYLARLGIRVQRFLAEEVRVELQMVLDTVVAVAAERGVPPRPPSGRSPSPAGGGDDAAPPASPPPAGEGDHAQHGGGGSPPSVSSHALTLATFLPYRLSVASTVVSEGLARIYEERFDIGIPEWRVLSTVGEFASITAKAIGLHAHMSKVKVSRAAASLEARGLIRRTPNPEDMREAFLVHTPAGRAMYDEIAPLALGYVARLTDGFSADDLAALDGLIERLLAGAMAMDAAGS